MSSAMRAAAHLLAFNGVDILLALPVLGCGQEVKEAAQLLAALKGLQRHTCRSHHRCDVCIGLASMNSRSSTTSYMTEDRVQGFAQR